MKKIQITCGAHGTSASGIRGKKEKKILLFLLLIFLSVGRLSVLQVNHRLILVPASVCERERARTGGERKDERRLIVKKGLVTWVHNFIPSFFFFIFFPFHLHLTQHWYRKLEKSLLPSNFLFPIFTQDAIRAQHTVLFGPLLFPALWPLSVFLSLSPHFFPSVGKLREWQYATLAAQNCDEMRRELRGTTPPAKGRGSTKLKKEPKGSQMTVEITRARMGYTTKYFYYFSL